MCVCVCVCMGMYFCLHCQSSTCGAIKFAVLSLLSLPLINSIGAIEKHSVATDDRAASMHVLALAISTNIYCLGRVHMNWYIG
jgi:hypothetical protein